MTLLGALSILWKSQYYTREILMISELIFSSNRGFEKYLAKQYTFT